MSDAMIKSIQKLIEQFSKLPTVGPRTAARFVFYLIHQPKEKTEELIKAIEDLKNKIKICSLCSNSFEPSDEQILCPICSDPARDKSLLCLVGKEVDLEIIEKTKKYTGRYFILGESPKLEKLIERIKNEKIKEIILALNPTTEGKRLTLEIQRKLKDLDIKITRLGLGLPVGGELEYADEETIASALEGKKQLP